MKPFSPLLALALLVSALTPVAAMGTAAEDEIAQFPFAHEAGDLDGDGVEDIVTISRVDVADDTTGLYLSQFSRLRARSGATGELLWTLDVDSVGLDEQITPVTMADGPGVVLSFRYGLDGPPTSPCAFRPPVIGGCFGVASEADLTDLHLIGISASGEALWSGSFDYAPHVTVSSEEAGGGVDVSYGAAQSVVGLRGADGDRLVVPVRELPSASAGEGLIAGRGTLLRYLDPTTGTTTDSAIAPTANGPTQLHVWPGLTDAGDGVVLLAEDRAVAFGAGGEFLWDVFTGVRDSLALYPLGDLDGDGRGDHALSGHAHDEGTAPRTAVLTAAGHVLRSDLNQQVAFPRTVDEEGRTSEVMLLDYAPVLGSQGAQPPDGFDFVQLTRVSATGERVEQGLALSPDATWVYGFTGYPGRNDLTGDGSGDVAYVRAGTSREIEGLTVLGDDVGDATTVELTGVGSIPGSTGAVLGPDELAVITQIGGSVHVLGLGADGVRWDTDLGITADPDSSSADRLSASSDIDRLGPEDDPVGYLVNIDTDRAHTAVLGLDGQLRWVD